MKNKNWKFKETKKTTRLISSYIGLYRNKCVVVLSCCYTFVLNSDRNRAKNWNEKQRTQKINQENILFTRKTQTTTTHKWNALGWLLLWLLFVKWILTVRWRFFQAKWTAHYKLSILLQFVGFAHTVLQIIYSVQGKNYSKKKKLVINLLELSFKVFVSVVIVVVFVVRYYCYCCLLLFLQERKAHFIANKARNRMRPNDKRNILWCQFT